MATGASLGRSPTWPWPRTRKRPYSIPLQIPASRRAYDPILEEAKKGEDDLAGWLYWFLETVEQGMRNSRELTRLTIMKADFWKRFSGVTINDR